MGIVPLVDQMFVLCSSYIPIDHPYNERKLYADMQAIMLSVYNEGYDLGYEDGHHND